MGNGKGDSIEPEGSSDDERDGVARVSMTGDAFPLRCRKRL
jgi:hypothetical protein